MFYSLNRCPGLLRTRYLIEVKINKCYEQQYIVLSQSVIDINFIRIFFKKFP